MSKITLKHKTLKLNSEIESILQLRISNKLVCQLSLKEILELRQGMDRIIEQAGLDKAEALGREIAEFWGLKDREELSIIESDLPA